MGAEFYVLMDARNKTALMRDGKPFVYTTLLTAELGAKWLGRKRRTKFRVVPRFTGAVVN